MCPSMCVFCVFGDRLPGRWTLGGPCKERGRGLRLLASTLSPSPSWGCWWPSPGVQGLAGVAEVSPTGLAAQSPRCPALISGPGPSLLSAGAPQGRAQGLRDSLAASLKRSCSPRCGEVVLARVPQPWPAR